MLLRVAEISSIIERAMKGTESPSVNVETAVVVNVPPVYIISEYNGDITTVNRQFNSQFSKDFICKVTKME